MAQLSATVNTRQPGILPSITVQNQKNDGHYMEITTWGSKQTIDPPIPSNNEITTWGGKQTIIPPIPSNKEKLIKDNDKVVELLVK